MGVVPSSMVLHSRPSDPRHRFCPQSMFSCFMPTQQAGQRLGPTCSPPPRTAGFHSSAPFEYCQLTQAAIPLKEQCSLMQGIQDVVISEQSCVSMRNCPVPDKETEEDDC